MQENWRFNKAPASGQRLIPAEAEIQKEVVGKVITYSRFAISLVAGLLIWAGCRATAQVRVEDLRDEWRTADGEGVFITEEKLFSALVRDPNSFYRAFSGDSAGFNLFVDKLHAGVFRAYGYESLRDLEHRRINALSTLKHAAIEEQYLTMNQVVIRQLEAIRANSVD